MYRSHLCLLVTLFFHQTLLPMQLARAAKTKSPMRRVARNYATTPQDDAKKQKPTIISYKGNDYTPLELAQHVALQGLASGMNVVKKCADSNVECKCIAPYNCIPSEEIEYYHHIRSAHASLQKRLEYACEYIGDNHALSAELNRVKSELCPRSSECNRKLHLQMFRKPITAACIAFTLSLNPVTAPVSCIGLVAYCLYLIKNEDDVSRPIESLHRHLDKENDAIRTVLTKAEPYIMEKAKLQKEPISKAATQPLYLPLPKKKD